LFDALRKFELFSNFFLGLVVEEVPLVVGNISFELNSEGFFVSGVVGFNTLRFIVVKRRSFFLGEVVGSEF